MKCAICTRPAQDYGLCSPHGIELVHYVDKIHTLNYVALASAEREQLLDEFVRYKRAILSIIATLPFQRR